MHHTAEVAPYALTVFTISSFLGCFKSFHFMASVMWAVMACMTNCHSDDIGPIRPTKREHINMLKGEILLKLLARLPRL